MKLSFALNRKTLIILSTLATLLTLIFSICVVSSIHVKKINSEKIRKAILSAEKVSRMEEKISFERALRLYHLDQTYAVFTNNCFPKYVTDIKITSKHCLGRSKIAEWLVLSNGENNVYIVGYV